MDEQYWMHEYRTGRTKPRKNRSGLIALLLIGVIFLAGIISALSFLNIRLFRQLENQEDNNSTPLSFSQNEETQPDATTEPTASVSTEPDISFDLAQSPPSVENIPQEGGLSLQAIYEKAIPSVVSISCILNNGTSSGTGVVLSSDGYLLTNCHVVEGAGTITATFSDGRSLSALIVGQDEISDLAVLQVEADDLTAAEFGDSSVLRVGDAVAAIGDPLGAELRGTMTDGIISAINRDIEADGRVMTLIQTNAALNSGNSGGPLLNCYGQVIGINTLKIGDFVDSAGVEGLGFAIPSATVKEVVDQLISYGYVVGRPTLGMNFQELSFLYQQMYQLPQGLYISEVAEGSHAEQLGISPGDILVGFDGVRIIDVDTLRSLLYTHQAGDQVEIVIYRSGRQYQLTLTIDQAE